MTETMQLFDQLPAHIEAALVGSIERFGVLVPVIKDQHGRILDGHHRARIAHELNIDYPTDTRHVANDEEASEIARTLNADRRHLTEDQRREIAAQLRAEGHSLRAIGGALGVSHSQVQRDLTAVTGVTAEPEYVVGLDGKRQPARRPTRPTTVEHVAQRLAEADDEPAASSAHLAEAQAIVETANDAGKNVNEAVEEAVSSRRDINKPDLGNGISHPARYTNALLPRFADIITAHYGDTKVTVLDPFAGTGKIHDLSGYRAGTVTQGIELEPEWAALHPQTDVGNALALPYTDDHFDVVCTSPTYGNRLADKHNASDPERRRSYTHDLGRPLTDDNSGGMQWGDEYRQFHVNAWTEALRVLRPGGLLIVNIKDHIRNGNLQLVAMWHQATIVQLGASYRHDLSCLVGTPSLRAGANSRARTDHEFILAYEKDGHR